MAKVNWFLRSMTIILVVLAVASIVALLAKDAGVGPLRRLPVHVLSGAALLLAGGASLLIQPITCLQAKKFLKNALLAATFILWGAVQFMPQNVLSMRLGDFVVALFVVDLVWATLIAVNRQGARAAQPDPAKCHKLESVLRKSLLPPGGLGL